MGPWRQKVLDQGSDLGEGVRGGVGQVEREVLAQKRSKALELGEPSLDAGKEHQHQRIGSETTRPAPAAGPGAPM